MFFIDFPWLAPEIDFLIGFLPCSPKDCFSDSFYIILPKSFPGLERPSETRARQPNNAEALGTFGGTRQNTKGISYKSLRGPWPDLPIPDIQDADIPNPHAQNRDVSNPNAPNTSDNPFCEAPGATPKVEGTIVSGFAK